MKFTIPWLKEHLDTECSSEEILEKLNMIGLEVESFNNPKKLYEDFSVCEVLSVEKHPDADKLNKCLLNTKNGHIEVICGANNGRHESRICPCRSIYSWIGYLFEINQDKRNSI